jgi:hypothetical protein
MTSESNVYRACGAERLSGGSCRRIPAKGQSRCMHHGGAGRPKRKPKRKRKRKRKPCTFKDSGGSCPKEMINGTAYCEDHSLNHKKGLVDENSKKMGIAGFNIDTAYFLCYVKIPDDDMNWLIENREAARKACEVGAVDVGAGVSRTVNKSVKVEAYGMVWNVCPNALPGYRVMIENDNFAIVFRQVKGKSWSKTASMKVMARSKGLWFFGPKKIFDWVNDIVCLVHCDKERGRPHTRFSRIDMCLDFFGHDFSASSEPNFVRRAHSVELNSQELLIDKRSFLSRSKFTGLSFGRRTNGLYARLYLKSHEVNVSGKTWITDLWRDTPEAKAFRSENAVPVPMVTLKRSPWETARLNADIEKQKKLVTLYRRRIRKAKGVIIKAEKAGLEINPSVRKGLDGLRESLVTLSEGVKSRKAELKKPKEPSFVNTWRLEFEIGSPALATFFKKKKFFCKSEKAFPVPVPNKPLPKPVRANHGEIFSGLQSIWDYLTDRIKNEGWLSFRVPEGDNRSLWKHHKVWKLMHSFKWSELTELEPTALMRKRFRDADASKHIPSIAGHIFSFAKKHRIESMKEALEAVGGAVESYTAERFGSYEYAMAEKGFIFSENENRISELRTDLAQFRRAEKLRKQYKKSGKGSTKQPKAPLTAPEELPDDAGYWERLDYQRRLDEFENRIIHWLEHDDH